MARIFNSSSYEQWLDFTFGNDAPTYLESVAWNVPPKTILSWITRMFSNGGLLLNRYGPLSIENALWLISGPSSVFVCLFDVTIELSNREICLECVTKFFEDTYCKHVQGSACYMWWENLYMYAFPNLVENDLTPCISRIVHAMSLHDCEQIRLSAEHAMNVIPFLSNELTKRQHKVENRGTNG